MNKDEKDVLLDHNYDGIQEFDFSLPNWWLATFWGGIVFGVGYIIYFLMLNGPSLEHEYYADADKIHKIRRNYVIQLKKFDQAKFDQFMNDENMKLIGKEVFDNNCMACHNKNGAGDIGPNLTDSYWLFTEGTQENLFKFIITGNPSEGMPAWGTLLPKEDIYAVAAYIESIKGFTHTNPVAKEPQGDKFPEEE